MKKQRVITNPNLLIAVLLLGCMAPGLGLAFFVMRPSPVNKLIESRNIHGDRYDARAITTLPNGVYRLQGEKSWTVGSWGEFRFQGLDGSVELPYDVRQSSSAVQGEITIQVSARKVRVIGFKGVK